MPPALSSLTLASVPLAASPAYVRLPLQGLAFDTSSAATGLRYALALSASAPLLWSSAAGAGNRTPAPGAAVALGSWASADAGATWAAAPAPFRALLLYALKTACSPTPSQAATPSSTRSGSQTQSLSPTQSGTASQGATPSQTASPSRDPALLPAAAYSGSGGPVGPCPHGLANLYPFGSAAPRDQACPRGNGNAAACNLTWAAGGPAVTLLGVRATQLFASSNGELCTAAPGGDASLCRR